MLDPSREYIAHELPNELRGQRSPSAAFRLFFHVVFSTRFRFRLLQAGPERRFMDLLLEIAEIHSFKVLAASVNEEHVHLILSLQPKHSISEVVKAIKGRTSRVLREEFPELQAHARLWTSGY